MADILSLVLNYAFAAWRRRALALAVAWVVGIMGWVTVSIMPDNYQSSAILHVDTANVLQPLLGGLTIDLDYQSEVDLMQRTLLSRPNLEKVLRDTDLDLTAQSEAELEALIQGLNSRIRVSRQGADLFAIKYENSDPQLAHDVVQSLLNIFVESNLGQSRGDLDTARRFIDDQIAAYEQRISASERRIADFQQKNLGMIRAQGDQQTAYDSAKARLETLEGQLRDAELRRTTLARELKTIPRFTGTATTSSFGAGPPTNTAVQILQAQQTLDTLLARYTDKHPDVIVAKRQLENLHEQQRQEVEAMAAYAAESSATADPDDPQTQDSGVSNPLYVQLKIQLVDQEAQVATLKERVEKARETVEEARAKAGVSLELEVQLARLNRDHDILMNSYNQLLASRETEQISRARDDQAESVRFRVMEPPTVPSVPAGPNRLLFLALVFVVSLASGFGLAVLLSLSSESFSSLAELRAAIGVPVLGTISTAVQASKGFAVYLRSAGFWAAAGTYCATFAALAFIEVRIGLNEVVAADLLQRLPAGVLQHLPI